MADEWYYLRGDQQVGPISRQALQEAAYGREVNGETLVWSEGMPQWSPARTVAGLTPAATMPPPIQPPMQGMPVSPHMVPGYAAMPKPDSHLLGAILTLVCCSPLFGIIATIYAAQVDGKYNAGDYLGATQASENASKWIWIAVIMSLVVLVMICVGLIVAG